MPSSLKDLSAGGLQKREERLRSEEELALARNELRLTKASFGIVDLSKSEESARVQLGKERQKEMTAEIRLRSVAKYFAGNAPNVHPADATKHFIGRIEVPCGDGRQGFVAPLAVNRAELRNFHSMLVT
jgi:hypothetical protein